MQLFISPINTLLNWNIFLSSYSLFDINWHFHAYLKKNYFEKLFLLLATLVQITTNIGNFLEIFKAILGCRLADASLYNMRHFQSLRWRESRREIEKIIFVRFVDFWLVARRRLLQLRTVCRDAVQLQPGKSMKVVAEYVVYESVGSIQRFFFEI